MYLQTKRKIGLLLAALLCSVNAMAAPIIYTFTTGMLGLVPVSFAPNLLPLLSPDAYVSGSFTYDPDGTLIGTAAAPSATGAEGKFYQAIDNIEGTLYTGGISYTFSATPGVTGVYNEGLSFTVPPDFPIPNPYPDLYDLLLLRGGQPSAPINGFTLGNLPLSSVRLFWIEALIPNTPDFLPNDALPDSLPSFSGRLALDFGASDASNIGSERVFFEGLRVTPVPLPGALMLLMSGMFTLFAGARVRRRGNLAA